ncbi:MULTISPECIES: hypothetical protein [Variovorax]|jgi:hypothetical protein|uniref:hypothetical protein n=1 Tax=Variovorax TaxID=34072 RepID=UPI0021ABD80A|nr:hypothetical protein [Variovorax paradoxus]MDP9607621.1 hypothetical protein [Variovorax paradoxus]UVH56227.1 hypothetical protein NWF24_25775 [Variovorax paradoxus]
MNTLFNIKTSILVVVMLVLPMAQAATMTKAEYQAGKTRISADVKADKAACVPLADNAKDICIEEAKAKEKVARAELEYGYTAKSSDRNKVLVAKAEAGYAVAKEKCDDQSGNAKDVCVQEAKALKTKALANAKMGKEIGEAKVDASQAKRDADYKVATEKCDSMSGDAKASCAAAAKTKFGKN